MKLLAFELGAEAPLFHSLGLRRFSCGRLEALDLGAEPPHGFFRIGLRYPRNLLQLRLMGQKLLLSALEFGAGVRSSLLRFRNVYPEGFVGLREAQNPVLTFSQPHHQGPVPLAALIQRRPERRVLPLQ